MARYSYHQLDANHRAIRKALEQAGASVTTGGPLDLIAGFQGRTTLLEVKTAKGKLRPSQERFLAGWRGAAAVVRTEEEALRAIGVIQ